MLNDAISVLRSPSTFFEEQADPDEWKGPAFALGVVVASSILVALASVVGRLIALPSNLAASLLVGSVFGIAIRAAFPLIVWLVYAVLFFGITALLDGEGDFRGTALLSAWGMLPRVGGLLVAAVLTLVATQLVPAPATAAGLNEYTARVGAHWANLLAILVRLLTFLWSGYVWVYAVERARSVTRKQAAIAVGLPVALEVGVTLILLLLAFVGSMMV